MKILIYIYLFALASQICYQSKQKSNQKQKKMNRQKKQLPIKEIQRIVHANNETIAKEEESAKKADEIWTKDSDGRDESEKASASGKISVRIEYKLAGPNDDNRQDLTSLSYIFNKKMLYFMDEENNYRSVNSGIDLAGIVSAKQDNPLTGRCCYRVQQVQQVKIDVYGFEGFCFHLDNLTEDYLFCDTDNMKVEKFREQLIQFSMNAYFIKMGIESPTFLRDQGQVCKNPLFNWQMENQEQWPCNCIKGEEQSPLTINNPTVVLQNEDRIHFDFKDAEIVRYGIVRQEPEFHGDFGKFSHISPQKTIEYSINKIVFKVGSEHAFEGVAPDQPNLYNNIKSGKKKAPQDSIESVGELLIYGTGDGMEKAILSILYGVQTNPKTFQNNFIQYMNLDDSKFNYNGVTNVIDEFGQPLLKCLNFIKKPSIKGSEYEEYYYPNLSDMILSNQKGTNSLYRDSSFYWYQGSDSKPPCEEGIMRYIMKRKAYIGQDQLNTLQKKILIQAGIKTRTNTRVAQPLNDRKVYYHNSCPYDEDLQKPQEEIPDYKFIKATQKVKLFAFADEEFPIKKIFKIHANSKTPDTIVVNKNLIVNKLQKEPFKKEAGPENIEKLTKRWIDQYGPFPEPKLYKVEKVLQSAGMKQQAQAVNQEVKNQRLNQIKAKQILSNLDQQSGISDQNQESDQENQESDQEEANE